MIAQLSLFPRPPRKPRRVIMKSVDQGEAPGKMPGWRTTSGGHFVCQKCGHDDGWSFDMTWSEIMRGLPCPKCNEGKA